MPNSWTLTPAPPRDDEVAEFVDDHERHEDDEQQDRQLIRPLARKVHQRRRSSVATVAASPGADLGIECDELVQARVPGPAEALDGAAHSVGDAREAERAVEEAATATSSAAISAALARGPWRAGGAAIAQRRKARPSSGASKVRSAARAGRGAAPARQAPRDRSGVLDGNAHIGKSELCLEGAVDELHQRVDDALRMNDDIDPDRRRTSYSQRASMTSRRLVHERGRVDRDLARPCATSGEPAPARESTDAESVGRPGPERTAARGEDQPADIVASCSPARHCQMAECSLVDRPEPVERARGTAVRHRVGREPARQRHHEMAAGDERFLVGRGDDLACARAPPGPRLRLRPRSWPRPGRPRRLRVAISVRARRAGRRFARAVGPSA